MMPLAQNRIRLLLSILLLDICCVSAQNTVRLDDTYGYSASNPNGIQYSNSRWGDLSPQNDQMRYNQSYTATNSSGANLVLFFRGKSIKYYGDRDPAGGIATVRIDGQPYTNVSVSAPASGFQAQQLLWSSPALDSGDHQIVISNIGARVNPRKGLIGLDFLEITPNSAAGDITPLNLGPGASSIPKNATLVDSFDKGLAYAGNGWQNKTSTPDSTIYLRGSARTTRFPGDSCFFQFNGSAVWYFTDYSLVNAVVAISVDGAPPDLVDTAPSNATLSRSQRLTWSRTNLTDGPHTISITHAGLAGSWATIDYFRFMPSSESSNSVTSSSTSASIASSLTSASIAASTSQSITSSTATSSIGGEIAGAIIGGVFALILIAFGVLITIRRRLARQRSENIRGMKEKSFNSLATSARPILGPNGSSVSHVTSSRTGRSVM